MTQNRAAAYHAPNTSSLHNGRAAGVTRPGVYSGYRVRVNAAEPDRLDITTGDDALSVLVTYEGVRIEETADLFGVLAVQNADATQTRVDLAVAEYRFSPDAAVEQTYKIVRGRYPASGETAEPPEPQSVYQIPLAYVRVRPQSALGGTTRARIEVVDIVHVGLAAHVAAPSGVSSLRPIVEPSDRRRLFVHAGLMPSYDGAAAIEFAGAHSEPIDPDGLDDDEARWYLFGVTDDGTVDVIGDAATETGLPSFTSDAFPVCRVRGRKLSGAVILQEIVDLRFPFVRQFVSRDEEEPYRAALADSVFQHLRIEPFRNLDLLALDTLSDADNVEVTLNRGDTSVELAWTGDSDPTDDVTIATVDLLSGTSIGTVEHFMVLVDGDVPGLRMKFSTAGRFTGFSAAVFAPNTIVRVPSGGAVRLHLQFVVPAAAFAAGAVPRLRSFGCFFRLNSDSLSPNTVADVGLDTLQAAVPNLIANGDFRYWSRDDADGNTPDPAAQLEIAYASTAEAPFAADGWQFTTFAFPARSSRIYRRGLTQDVLAAGPGNFGDTALVWEGAGGAGGATNVLEYRVPLPASSVGRRVTFAVRHKLSSIAALSIGVALYERTAEGSLRLQAAPTVVAPSAVRGDLLVVSDVAVNERTHAAAFLLLFRQTAGDSSVAVWNARAAVGEYRNLLYTESPNATDVLRKYYERGRLFASGRVLEGDPFGGSVQFGARKFESLGALEAATIRRSDSDRSLNLATVVYEATAHGLVATASATSSGSVRLDVDFEAAVRYAAVG